MHTPSLIIKLSLFFCFIASQKINSAEIPTRDRSNSNDSNSSTKTVVERFMPPNSTQPQRLLEESAQSQSNIQEQTPHTPLSCCALIYQGSKQIKTEWDNSYPFFKRCAWPPQVDHSNIHPDIVKCNEKIALCAAYTICCPCTIGFVVCYNFLDALSDPS